MTTWVVVAVMGERVSYIISEAESVEEAAGVLVRGMTIDDISRLKSIKGWDYNDAHAVVDIDLLRESLSRVVNRS